MRKGKFINEIPEGTPLNAGDEIALRKGDEGDYRFYNQKVAIDGELYPFGITEEEVAKLNRLTESELTKLEDLYPKDEIDGKFSNVNSRIDDVEIGVNGSIKTTDTLPQLNALPDGVYEAQTEGTYANSQIAKSGYYTKFKKVGTTWTLESEVKMPVSPADGIIQSGNTSPTSGNTVYNALKSSNVANNILFNRTLRTTSPTVNLSYETLGSSIRVYRTSGSSAGYGTIAFTLDGSSINWIKNHTYYVAVDLQINTLSDSNQCRLFAKYNDPTTVGTSALPVVPAVGVRGYMKTSIVVDLAAIDSNPTARQLIVQFKNFTAGELFEAVIYGISVIDITSDNITYTNADNLVITNGILKTYSEAGFVSKIAGKGLSTNDFDNTYKAKVDNMPQLSLKEVYSNLAAQFSQISGEGSITLAVQTDGSLKFTNSNTSVSGYRGYNFALDTAKYWLKDHKYLVAFEILVTQNSITEGSGSDSGNNYFSVRAKANAANLSISGSTTMSSLTTGTKGIAFAEVLISDTSGVITPTSRWLYLQFGNYSVAQTFDIKVYDVMVIDLTASNLSFEAAKTLVNANGIANDSVSIIDSPVENALKSDYAKVAGSVESFAVGGDMDLWGDSLVAQNWGNILATLLGRTVISHGFGGKKSTYIRDQFLANPLVKTRPQIICVGRNNYSDTEVIINDIRAMVAYMGHQNYLILTPPNGDYGKFPGEVGVLNEFKGGEGYNKFIELESRLSAEYGDNYLNSRTGCIQSYNFGGVQLLTAFIQPTIGSNVQISVSDTSILSNTNASTQALHEALTNKIAIGINGQFDVYSIVSIDSATVMTVSLIESNRISPGSNVANLIDDGGTSSLIPLTVMQYADLMFYRYDTTVSTFRTDRVHMSPQGLQTIAKVVARKVNAIKI